MSRWGIGAVRIFSVPRAAPNTAVARKNFVTNHDEPLWRARSTVEPYGKRKLHKKTEAPTNAAWVPAQAHRRHQLISLYETRTCEMETQIVTCAFCGVN